MVLKCPSALRLLAVDSLMPICSAYAFCPTDARRLSRTLSISTGLITGGSNFRAIAFSMGDNPHKVSYATGLTKWRGYLDVGKWMEDQAEIRMPESLR